MRDSLTFHLKALQTPIARRNCVFKTFGDLLRVKECDSIEGNAFYFLLPISKLSQLVLDPFLEIELKRLELVLK